MNLPELVLMHSNKSAPEHRLPLTTLWMYLMGGWWVVNTVIQMSVQHIKTLCLETRPRCRHKHLLENVRGASASVSLTHVSALSPPRLK